MASILKLSNGRMVPALGLGTWLSKPDEVFEAVRYAIAEAGYRHIDCAYVYLNEKEIGKAIKEVIDKGIVQREELFITSKCWSTFHSREKVMKCCKQSLSDLGLEYLDLYLIHLPMGFAEDREIYPKDASGNFIYSDVDYVETWQGMEDCYDIGLVKSLGLSNFNSEQIVRILSKAKVKPVMLQVECHPYLNQTQLIDFCKKHNILVTGYSPFGSPERPGAKPGDLSLLDDLKLKEIADKYNKTTAQILLRYQVERGVIPIPKSVNPSRIWSNIQIFDFNLNQEDISLINGLSRNHRYISAEFLRDHKYFPYNIPF
ncbi:aldo-keto reductase-like protein [Dinothrombium tinctorium]|uniref:Aldo-keto reductase-like protein n=1 Tax=Dinothrombium tinctorium TaxID=1965070 RepID=A0A3S3RN81_9ACAR|nr:aldo-keto reductase-like protein [Dinothrombium tinctorium]RWS02395.1 aldo-keto reductase-like protein [Dinothrombium tinctorium]RWS03479.1 aldo-keto reductase-like protein [Dinothrombium tinctorium]